MAAFVTSRGVYFFVMITSKIAHREIENQTYMAAPVAEWLRALFLNHSIISPGSPVFAPPTDWPVSYELK